MLASMQKKITRLEEKLLKDVVAIDGRIHNLEVHILLSAL